MKSLPTLYKNNSTGTGWWKIIPVLNPSNPGYQITYAKSKNAKAVKKFHPTFAKNIGRTNQTTAEEQAVKEAKARWKRQLDKGYTPDEPEAGTLVKSTLDAFEDGSP